MDQGNKKDLPEGHRKVLSLIPYGKGSAKTVKEIISALGGTDQEIRKTVQELVVQYGCPIGTSNERDSQGYYRITNEDERKATIRNLRSRMKHLHRRISAIRKGNWSEVE